MSSTPSWRRATARRDAKMFYLLYPLADVFTPFNLFRYLTFRSIAAFLTALVLSFLIGGGLIRWRRSKQRQGQPIRDDGPASHLVTKKGTPTMGGLLILITLTIATLLWADLTNPYVWIVLAVTLTFGAVGFWDDFLKVTKRNPKGVPGKVKLALSVVAAGVAAWLIAQSSPAPLRYMLAFPFLKDVLLPLSVVGFVLFAILVMVGASNAVNLTDGLDGLAIGPVIMASAVFGFIAYVVGNTVLTNYLYLHHIPRSGELAVLLSALVGAGLGFLWFNAPPAMVFMGDTGSLAIARSASAPCAPLGSAGTACVAWDAPAASRETAAKIGVPVVEPASIDWSRAPGLIISPGIPSPLPKPHPVAAAARAAGKKIICDIELLARAQPKAGFVGITGTNGKSTTTALIAPILAHAGPPSAVPRNIRPPALHPP